MRFTHDSSYAAIEAFTLDVLTEHLPAAGGWSSQELEAFRGDPSQESIKDLVIDDATARAFGIDHDAFVRAQRAPHHDFERDHGPGAWSVHNAIHLALHGIGRDRIHLNDTLPDDSTLGSFRTIGDWDHAVHMEQNAYAAQGDPTFQPSPYMGHTYASWARGVVKDRFAYLTLSTLAHHIGGELEGYAQEWIRHAVPHRYVPNEDHGKKVQGGTLFSQRLDADGKEELHRVLNEAAQVFQRDRHGTIAAEAHARMDRRIWTVCQNDSYEHGYVVIFASPAALDSVRWTSFLDDVRMHAGDPEELDALLVLHRAELEQHLQATFAAHPQGGGSP